MCSVVTRNYREIRSLIITFYISLIGYYWELWKLTVEWQASFTLSTVKNHQCSTKHVYNHFPLGLNQRLSIMMEAWYLSPVDKRAWPMASQSQQFIKTSSLRKLMSLVHIPSANREDAGFITYSAGSHQGVIKTLWLHVFGSYHVITSSRPWFTTTGFR